MSENIDLSRRQSNYLYVDVLPRPRIVDVDTRHEETKRFLPEQTHRGLAHDHLARRAQRIIRTYLAAGALVLAGSIVATEHYKSDITTIQRHAVDRVTEESSLYAASLKAETLKEFDKLGPGKPTLEVPGQLIVNVSQMPHQEA